MLRGIFGADDGDGDGGGGEWRSNVAVDACAESTWRRRKR